MNTQTKNDLFRRPADVVLNDMDELIRQAEADQNNSTTRRVKSSNIVFKMNEDDEADDAILLETDQDKPLPLSHYSLTQVASMAKIPVAMIERLYRKGEIELIVDNLNALYPRASTDEKMILIRNYRNEETLEIDHRLIRAVNGSAYSRLWDAEVFSEIDDWLTNQGFDAGIPTNIYRSPLMNGQCALFRGDQTSFGFFFTDRAETATLGDALGGLCPGIMVWNSEVGARSFGFHTFYMHRESGSPIIWTPSNHKRKRFVHRGNIQNGFREYVRTLEDTGRNFRSRFYSDLEVFNDMTVTPFAQNDDDAAEKLNKSYGIPKVEARHIVNIARTQPRIRYGDELSVWRIALAVCWDANQTSRAEVMVDDSLVATKIIQKFSKK